VRDSIAGQLLDELPSLNESSVVHDNGCSYGAVTMTILGSDLPTGLKIHATDVNPMFLAQMRSKLSENPRWPVNIETMDARKSTFADNTFDLSFTNFVFAGLSEGIGADSHIMRTLKPGGTGVIAVWAEMPWHIALENAHHKTRGAEEPMAPFLSKIWYKKERIEQVAKDAGWKNVKFVQKEAYLNLGTALRGWASTAWTFLGTPVGDWQQHDEDKWDEVLDSIVDELRTCEGFKVEDGVNWIRMVADVAIAQK
jgi:ubiquinone/menaquinone biosynthesis C-methylase UbiE